MNSISNSSPSTPSLANILSLANQKLFGFAVLLSIAPFWFGPYIPIVDLPQHAAQVSALRELWSGNPFFVEHFHVNWFTPYLLGYLALYALALVFPITVAAQLLVSLSVAAMPFATGALLREGGADERWKWLAIPCSYGFGFYWGFLSFIVSAPLVLLFLIATIRFVNAPSWRRGCGIAAFSLLLFFCHIIVLGFASFVALSYLSARTLPRWRTLVVMALPYTAPIPLIVMWVIRMYQQEAAVQDDSISFAPMLFRLYNFLYQPAGRETFSWLALLVTAAVALFPLFAGARVSRRPERLLPFGCALLVFLVAPHYAMGTAYLFQRMGIFLVPFWLLTLERPTKQRLHFEWLAMIVVTVWCMSNAARFAAFAKETQSFREVIAHVEPGKRLGGFIVDKWTPLFMFPVYFHFPSWYQAQQQGIADFNFADFHPQMVRYKGPSPARLGERQAWQPETFEWNLHGGATYDYFLVRCPVEVAAQLFKDKVGAVQLIAHKDGWWLYQNKERLGRSSTASRVDGVQRSGVTAALVGDGARE